MPVLPEIAIAIALPPAGDSVTLQPVQSADAVPESPDCTTDTAPSLAIAMPIASPVLPLATESLEPVGSPVEPAVPESPDVAVAPAEPGSVSATRVEVPVLPL